MTSNAQQSSTGTLSTGPIPAPLVMVWDQLVSLAQEQQAAATVSSAMRPGSSNVQPTPLVATAVETVVETAVVTTTTLYVTVPAAPSSTASTSTETTSSVSTTSQRTLTSTTSTTSSATLPSSSVDSSPVFSLDITTSSTQTSSSAGFQYASSTTAPADASHNPTIKPGPMQTDGASESMAGLPNSSRKAIVGGLAGAIAGLLIIGLILIIFIRRRQKRQEKQEAENFAGEKGLKPLKLAKPVAAPKPGLVRKLSDLALGVGRNRSTPELPQPRTPSPVDGSLIRVSTGHWSRPFRTSEGMRESLEPAPLRITNPDASRSNTPRPGSAPGFIRKQSSALAAVFVTDSSRSKSYDSTTRADLGPISYPKPLHITSAMSRKLGLNGPQTPSFRSNPSATSLPIVTQQPPEDPFVASMVQATQRSPPSKRRQSLAKASQKISQQLSGKSPFRKPPTISPWTGMSNPNAPDPMAFGFERSVERSPSVASSDYTRSRRTTAHTINTAQPRVSEPFDLVISPSGPWEENWVSAEVVKHPSPPPPPQQQQQPPPLRPRSTARPNSTPRPVVAIPPPVITVSPPKASATTPAAEPARQQTVSPEPQTTGRHQRQKTMSPVSPLSPTVDDDDALPSSSPNWKKVYEGT